MKGLVLLAIALTICSVYSESSRRSENTPPDGAKERDTPFWAPRGKKSHTMAQSIRCGLLRPFEETHEEPSWTEMDSSERFYDKNVDLWSHRFKRSSDLSGPPSLDNELRRRLWLLKSYMEPSSQMESDKNLNLLTSWLKLVEKRKAGNGNSGNGNTNTDASNVPFWAARG